MNSSEENAAVVFACDLVGFSRLKACLSLTIRFRAAVCFTAVPLSSRLGTALPKSPSLDDPLIVMILAGHRWAIDFHSISTVLP